MTMIDTRWRDFSETHKIYFVEEFEEKACPADGVFSKLTSDSGIPFLFENVDTKKTAMKVRKTNEDRFLGDYQEFYEKSQAGMVDKFKFSGPESAAAFQSYLFKEGHRLTGHRCGVAGTSSH